MTLQRDRTGEFLRAADAAARRRRVSGKSGAGNGAASGSESERAGLLSHTQPLVVNTAESFASGTTVEVPRASHGTIDEFEALADMRKRKPDKPKSAFAAEAAQVGRDIAAVSTKLERLTTLAKSRSLFDEDTRTPEIQKLTVVINNDIKDLNERISAMQERSNASTSSKQQADRHIATVLGSLKSKLKGAAKSFSDVLELRTESLKLQAKNREAFTGNGASAAAGGVLGIPGAGGDFGAAPGSFGGTSFGAGAAPSFGDSPLYGGPASHAIQMPPESGGMSVQTQALGPIQDRSEIVRGIESTIVELQGIFQQLASLVAEQGEMIERIDSNVEESVTNIDTAQNELLRYLRSVGSNRGLVLKLFGVLVVFIIVFILLM